MRDVLLPPATIGALLLVFAGAAKLRAPGSAARTLRRVGLPGSDGAARGAGALETLVGASVLGLPGRSTFGLLGLTYALLAVVAAASVLRGGLAADCGCFGEADGRAGRGHLLANALFASVAAVLAYVSPQSPDGLPLGLPTLAFAAGIWSGAVLVRALLTLFPSAWGAYGGQA